MVLACASLFRPTQGFIRVTLMAGVGCGSDMGVGPAKEAGDILVLFLLHSCRVTPRLCPSALILSLERSLLFARARAGGAGRSRSYECLEKFLSTEVSGSCIPYTI